MNRFESTQITTAYREYSEDRVAVAHDGERTIIVVADGAGGIGHGDSAADSVIREIMSARAHAKTAQQWNAALRRTDGRIADGQSTAVIVDLTPHQISGSSVGDSQAWIIHDGHITDLTARQKRKPLLGSQEASPVGFTNPALKGLLIVATDGFCDYVKRDALPSMIAKTDFLATPQACVEMVRLPSGSLWDDIGIVACRMRPPVSN